MKKTLFLSAILATALCQTTWAETVTLGTTQYQNTSVMTTGSLASNPGGDYLLLATGKNTYTAVSSNTWLTDAAMQTIIIAPATREDSSQTTGGRLKLDNHTIYADMIVGGSDSDDLYMTNSGSVIKGSLTAAPTGRLQIWNQNGTNHIEGAINAEGKEFRVVGNDSNAKLRLSGGATIGTLSSGDQRESSVVFSNTKADGRTAAAGTTYTVGTLYGNGNGINYVVESNIKLTIGTVDTTSSINNAGNLSITDGGTLNGVTNSGTLTLAGTTTLRKVLTNNGTLTLAENAGIDVKNIAATYIFDTYEGQTDGFASGKEVYTVISGNAAAYSQVVMKKNGAVQSGYNFDGNSFIGNTSVTTSRYVLVEEDNYTTSSLASTASTATELSISADKTLVVDSTKWGLDKISGAGNVTVSTATSLANSACSAATGTLTVNGVQLSVGNGDSKTSSLSSFSDVVLDGGTIYYNNNHDTLHNVSVATGKTGTIYSYDMGQDGATLTLADTTTVNGTLNIWNRYNALFAIQDLAGSGTLNISGTDGGTSSNEGATYNLNLDNFTGTINITTNKATVNRTFNSITDMASAATNYSVGSGTVTNVCTGGLSGGTVTFGDISGEITGAITGGTLNAGSGALTLTGKVSGGTINGNGTVTLSGQIAGGTIEEATYKGNNLTGGTLNNVTLAANERLNVHDGSATLGNVTHATTRGANDYAVVIYSGGQLTINGAADFTTNQYSKIGIDGECKLIVDNGGHVATSGIYWSTNSHNGNVTVKKGGELNVTGEVHLKTLSNAGTVTIGSVTDMDKLTNSGTMTLNGAATSIASITLGGGSLTLGSAAVGGHDFDLTTTTLSVDGDATINANLVVNSGTLTFAKGAVLTMGCDVTINGSIVNVTIDSTFDEFMAGLRAGNIDLVVIDGITSEDEVKALTLSGLYVTDSTGSTFTNNELSLKLVENNGLADHGAYCIVVAPEPATATLSLLALAALASRRRRH